MATEDFDPELILRALARHEVELVVVGGVAVQTHGYVRGTQDLDVIPDPDLLNLARLGEALSDLGARLHRSAQRFDVTDPELLRSAPRVAVMTRHGRLDLLQIGTTAGTPRTYAELRAGALEVDVGFGTLAVAGLDDLIRMKRAAGREQDRIDIGALTVSDEVLDREAGEST